MSDLPPLRRIRRACLLGLLLLAGCTRTPPHRQPVEAETPLQLTLWRANLAQQLTPEEWRWFDAVVQEHKLRLMLAGRTTGAAAQDEAVRKIIHGRPLDEVMREGLQLRLGRKRDELAEMKTALARNEEKRALFKPAQTDLIRDFTHHQDELQRKIVRAEEEIAATRAALDAFDARAAR